MKNNKGFTLVELLAMLVVLGVLMGVTIPNITGILEQSKKNSFIQDATKMVESAKIKIATHKTGYDKIPKIAAGQCVVFTLDYLNDNEDIGKGPNDGTYLDYESFVIYKLEENPETAKLEKKYYVRLVEKKSQGKYSGIDLKEYSEIEHNTVKIESITDVTTDEDVLEDSDNIDEEELEDLDLPEDDSSLENGKSISDILKEKVVDICHSPETTIYK